MYLENIYKWKQLDVFDFSLNCYALQLLVLQFLATFHQITVRT